MSWSAVWCPVLKGLWTDKVHLMAEVLQQWVSSFTTTAKKKILPQLRDFIMWDCSTKCPPVRQDTVMRQAADEKREMAICMCL